MKNLTQLLTALSLFVLPMISNAQNIYTIAGNGDPGYSGDGLSATSMYCELDLPSGICMDASGNLYIADAENNVIRIVNTSGIITTFAGSHALGAGFSGDNGPATDAQMNYCIGVCMDTIGNIYIADQGNNVIRLVNTSGIISTIAGIGVGGFSGDGGPATSAELYRPAGVYVDANGSTFITDPGNWRVRKINSSGIISTIAGNGIRGYTGDGGLADTSEINYPIGISGDSAGNIYFADATNSRIRKINTSNIITTFAGNGKHGYSGDGGFADTSELNYPYDVYIEKNGSIYIADSYNQRIRKVDNSGIISTVAGITEIIVGQFSGDGGPATAAELAYPWGLAVDIYGNLYLADNNNQRIRKIVYSLDGIESIDNINDFTLFPNPVTQTLTLNLNRQLIGLATLSVMDITGREVLSCEKNINSDIMQVDVSFLSPAMYFISIKNKGISMTQKFIKQKF